MSKTHVVVELLVDDQPVVSLHGDSPSIVCNTIEDNENFDKINHPPVHNLHISHFHAKMDRYRSKRQSHYTHRSLQPLTSLWKQSHLMSMAPDATPRM